MKKLSYKQILPIILGILIAMSMPSCTGSGNSDTASPNDTTDDSQILIEDGSQVSPPVTEDDPTSIPVTGTSNSASEAVIHFIDVGQADSIFIVSGDEYMLVDAGNNGDTDLVVSYLKNQGVSKLDYLIGTHPHEDHIGGLELGRAHV